MSSSMRIRYSQPPQLSSLRAAGIDAGEPSQSANCDGPFADTPVPEAVGSTVGLRCKEGKAAPQPQPPCIGDQVMTEHTRGRHLWCVSTTGDRWSLRAPPARRQLTKVQLLCAKQQNAIGRCAWVNVGVQEKRRHAYAHRHPIHAGISHIPIPQNPRASFGWRFQRWQNHDHTCFSPKTGPMLL